MTHRPCPNPRCQDGTVSTWDTPPRGELRVRQYACSYCSGRGTLDPLAEDLALRGVYLVDPTDEDFRSSPTHAPRREWHG
jgi:hypothetical protein